ncbi:MAG: ABC transporter permease [Bacteroidaceae bacterium]|nr:ABC transporter permease [Bacteroidaceae bacterium]
MNSLYYIKQTALREWYRMLHHPVYLWSIILPPLFCIIIFTSLMNAGLPTKLPAGAVDEDDSPMSRHILHTLDAFEYTHVIAHYPTFSEARKAVQRGEIYGFYYLPKGTERQVLTGRQPTTSFYINYSYLVAASLLYEDMRTISELANGTIKETQLYAHGALPWETIPRLQPIVINTHPLGNPWLNYSVYLNNTILPGVLMLMIFLITIYSIGSEVKEKTANNWLQGANNHILPALIGKLLPQTALFTLMAWGCMVWLYCWLKFPCQCGISTMLFTSVLMVVAAQGFGIFLYSLFPWMRFAMSVASLWGVISFSISGFTFPTMAMNPSLQALGYLFPLRHYYLIYVNNALNGYDISYAALPYICLLIFTLLPLPMMKRFHNAVTQYKYIE